MNESLMVFLPLLGLNPMALNDFIVLFFFLNNPHHNDNNRVGLKIVTGDLIQLFLY